MVVTAYLTSRLAIIALVLLLVSTACDSRRSSKQILEVWTLALSPYFDDYITELVEGFEAGHPGVEVIWVDVPFDAFNRKLVAAVAAGRGPDVINLSDRDFARVAALGGLAGIDDYLEPAVTERYLAGARGVLRIGGRLRALPWYLTTSVRMVNEDRLAAGGLSAEGEGDGKADGPGRLRLADDWAGLREQARAYHEATGGFLFSLPLGDTSELPTMLLSEGLLPFREADGRLVADLDRPEIVAEVSAWVQLYLDGALPRSAATRDHTAVVELYQNGQIAVAQSGANMLRRIRDASPEVFASTRVLPPITGGLGRSHIAVMVMGVSASSERPALAAELAAWMTSPRHQTELAKRSGVLPSTPASLADPYFDPPAAEAASEGEDAAEGSAAGRASDDGPDAEAERLLAYARSLSARSLPDAVAFTPAIEAWPDLRRAFDEGIKAALLDGADVGQTLEQIDADWDRILRSARPATLESLPRPEPMERRETSADLAAPGMQKQAATAVLAGWGG